MHNVAMRSVYPNAKSMLHYISIRPLTSVRTDRSSTSPLYVKEGILNVSSGYKNGVDMAALTVTYAINMTSGTLNIEQMERRDWRI